MKLFFLLSDRVGIDIPKVEVRYEHLSVDGDTYVGSRATPTLLNSALNVIEVNLIRFFLLKVLCLPSFHHLARPQRVLIINNIQSPMYSFIVFLQIMDTLSHIQEHCLVYRESSKR